MSKYGYDQKGNRYYWRVSGEIKTEAGFKSKQECDDWINEKRNECKLDWRVGYMVKFRSESVQWYLVNKNGKEIR